MAALLSCAISLLIAGTTHAATSPVSSADQELAAPGKVVVTGVVPDEATRQAILSRTREVYGADRVVDQIGIGNQVAPPNWAQNVQKMISPDLRRVSRGQLKISGNTVELSGNVENEALRQQVVSQMSAQLNPTYTVRNGLKVNVSGQEAIDATLANRTIEFEPGNATLTPRGTRVLDQLLPVLQQFAGRRFEVIGHTDAQGGHAQNIALSAARADAVKAYLNARGIGADRVQSLGLGPDRPVASNDTPEGRARNRRIELRVLP